MGLEIVIRARDNYSISVYIKSDEVQEDSIVTDGTKTGFHFSIKEESDTEYTYVGYTEAECISDGEGGWYTDEYLYTYSGLYPGKTYNLAIQIDGSVASYEVYGKATTTSSQTQTWVYSSKSLGTNISKICSKELPFDDKPYRIYRCPVSFAGSGKAVFYSEGKLDVIGYLTTENDIERLLWYGSPSEYIEISGVNNTNFYITCDVVKGIQYYLIVRTFSGEELGTTTVYAEPPTAVAVSPWSWYSSNGPYTAEEEENLTNKAHNALSEKMSVSDFLNFSYLVWNDLCEKVGQMLVAAGGSWKDTAGAEYRNVLLSILQIVLFTFSPQNAVSKIVMLSKMYNNEKSSLCGEIAWGCGEKEIVSREVFSDIEKLNFEGKLYNCPKGWDEWLSKRYGAYMKLPPLEQQKSHHECNAYILNEEKQL